MSKLIKYPKKYLERFYTRNGNGWALTRGTGITLKIRRPGDKKEPPVVTPPEVKPTRLTTQRYTLTATDGMFTAFRFGDVILSMVTFDQVAKTLSATKALTDSGFVFEGTPSSLSIIIKNNDATINQFEWQYTREVAISENDGVQVQFANSGKYDTVEFLATFVDEQPNVPVEPVQPPPVVTPPAKEAVKRSLESHEFSIILDTGKRLENFVFNGLVVNNVTLSEIFYMANQTIPTIQTELLNDGNILRMKSADGMIFREVVIVPEAGQKVGIKEFADSDVQEYEQPGIIYETLTLLAEEKPVVEPPLTITVSYQSKTGSMVTSNPIVVTEDVDWKELIKTELASNPEYTVAIDNSDNITVGTQSKYATLPLIVTSNKPGSAGKTIENVDDINHVSDTVTFKPGDIVNTELHANIVVDKLIIDLPETMARFTLGNIVLEDTTSDIVKNVLNTHDRIGYEQLDGNKIAIVNKESEPLRLDTVIIADTIVPTEGRGITFHYEESNIRHEPSLQGTDNVDSLKFNSITLSKKPVVYHYDVTVNGITVYSESVEENGLINLNALANELNKDTRLVITEDTNESLMIGSNTSEEIIVIGKWRHLEDGFNDVAVVSPDEARILPNDKATPNFKVTLIKLPEEPVLPPDSSEPIEPPVVTPPDTPPDPVPEPDGPVSEENCYLLVEVKVSNGYNDRDSNIPLPDNGGLWLREPNADMFYNEETGKVEYTRDLVTLKGKNKSQVDAEVENLIRKYTLGECEVVATETGYLIENNSKTNAWQVTITKQCQAADEFIIPDVKTAITANILQPDGVFLEPEIILQ